MTRRDVEWLTVLVGESAEVEVSIETEMVECWNAYNLFDEMPKRDIKVMGHSSWIFDPGGVHKLGYKSLKIVVDMVLMKQQGYIILSIEKETPDPCFWKVPAEYGIEVATNKVLVFDSGRNYPILMNKKGNACAKSCVVELIESYPILHCIRIFDPSGGCYKSLCVAEMCDFRQVAGGIWISDPGGMLVKECYFVNQSALMQHQAWTHHSFPLASAGYLAGMFKEKQLVSICSIRLAISLCPHV